MLAQTQIVQAEYTMGYALVAAFLILGLLLVCVPRPRKKDLPGREKDSKKKKRK